jgi:hypothetical protein
MKKVIKLSESQLVTLIKKIVKEESSAEKNNETDNTKKILFELINRSVKGADLYEHEDSIWLIFTDNKEWVIKLNKNNVLLYNYNFFNSIFKYLSLNVIKNQHYITEWVEDTFKYGVKYTPRMNYIYSLEVEDTIKNGVRYTDWRINPIDWKVKWFRFLPPQNPHQEVIHKSVVSNPSECLKVHINFMFEKSVMVNGMVKDGGDLALWNENNEIPDPSDKGAYDRFVKLLKKYVDGEYFGFDECEGVTFEEIKPFIKDMYLAEIQNHY